MRRQLRRRAAVAAVVLFLGGLLGMWLARVGPWNVDESRLELSEEKPSVLGGQAIDRGTRLSQPEASAPVSDSRSSDPLEKDTDGGPPEDQVFKTVRLFGDDCKFGVNAHCQEWRGKAEKCDSGDADACQRLGKLLIEESPMQPLWGSVLLGRACALGLNEACEPGERWREWSRYGFKNGADGVDDVPDGLSEACKSGNQVACGLLQMRRVRGDRPVDREAALKACRAGLRDMCAVLIEAARDAIELVSALEAGCDLPDAWLCYHLSTYFRPSCIDEHPICPEPNEERAQSFKRLACELEPLLEPCSH